MPLRCLTPLRDNAAVAKQSEPLRPDSLRAWFFNLLPCTRPGQRHRRRPQGRAVRVGRNLAREAQ